MLSAGPSNLRLLSDGPVRSAEHDFFGFQVYADALAGLIDDPVTETPMTIAISAPWGGGKTSVALLTQQHLDDRVAAQANRSFATTCWFNAWMHHDAPHLGAALAAAVAREAHRQRPWWWRAVRPLPTVMLRPHERWLRRIVSLALAVLIGLLAVAVQPARDIVTQVPGLNNKAVLEGSLVAMAVLALLVARSTFGVAEAAARFVDDPRSEAARGSMADVRAQLGKIVQGAGRGRMVIYVDDLERCDPARALEVCEVANQLLAQPNIITVLLADIDTIAASAGERYAPGDPQRAEVGRRFLEKIAQIQIALPPPAAVDMRRLLRGERPASRGPAQPTVEPVGRASPRRRRSVLSRVVSRVSSAIFALVILIDLALFLRSFRYGPWANPNVVLPVIGSVLAAAAVVGILALVLVRHHAASARRLDEAIDDVIDEEATAASIESVEQLDLLAQRVVAKIGSRHDTLVAFRVQDYYFDKPPELRDVEPVIVRHAPRLPRSAKRMLNNARLLTNIARSSGTFGGDPGITPAQLGVWIVLSERWPQVARRVAVDAELLRQLELARSGDELASLLTAAGEDAVSAPAELLSLLREAPAMHTVVARLVHLGSSDRGGLLAS